MLCNTCCSRWQSRGQWMAITGRELTIHHRETYLIIFGQLSPVVLR